MPWYASRPPQLCTRLKPKESVSIEKLKAFIFTMGQEPTVEYTDDLTTLMPNCTVAESPKLDDKDYN